MTENELLRQRIENLEKLVYSLNDLNTSEIGTDKLDDANFMALYSIVSEMAEKQGVDSKAFLSHFSARFRWWHDRSLREIEEISPDLAAKIDKRSIAECDVDPTYPPIFDPPPESNLGSE